MNRDEWKTLTRTWWCHGSGAAVSILLAMVVLFRAPRHVIFWFAVSFFIAHTVLAIARYVRSRRLRFTVAVTRTHTAATNGRHYPAMAFTPLPATALMADIGQKSPKNIA
jgi:hypothetical protein